MTGLARTKLGSLYKKEPDPEVKERLLLVLKVEGDSMIPARVAKEIHRSRTWASEASIVENEFHRGGLTNG